MEEFYVEEEEEQIDEYYEENKFDQMIEDLFNYSKKNQLPFFTHHNTYVMMQELLNLESLDSGLKI